MKQMDLSEWAKHPFTSSDEMVEAMRDPRYSSVFGTGYTAAVEAKVALSAPESIGQGHRDHTGRAISVHLGTPEDPHVGARAGRAQAVAIQAAEHAANLEAYGRLMGLQAITPSFQAGTATVTVVDHTTEEV